MRWIRDKDFIRGEIPMTKFEARVLIMGILEIEQGDMLLDIGAGTGSISVEAALHGASVYSVERETEGVALIDQNAQKFGAEIQIIEGTAPQALKNLPKFNKVFIGGTGRQLDEIVDWTAGNIEENGIVAGSFITLNNLVAFQQRLKHNGFREIETRMISSARVEGKAELLKAQNPIFIVRGKK